MPEVKSPEELRKIIHQKWGSSKRNPFEELVQDTVNQLASDEIDAGIEALHVVVEKCKTAGMSRQGCVSLCLDIEKRAIAKSDAEFVQVKIRAALTGSRKIIVH